MRQVNSVQTADPEQLSRGESDGVAISGAGRLSLAPLLDRLADGPFEGRPERVWAIASDRDGNVFLGTGPDGRIYRIGATGRVRPFSTVAEPLVTARHVTAEGRLFAGTSPGGRIWRIGPDGVGEPWGETGERYVWALAGHEDGTLFAGTGDRPGPNRLTFRTKPDDEISLSMQAKVPGPAMVSGPTELHLQHDRARGRDAYHRLLGDALRGDASLFARQDGVMEAWRIVEPVLASGPPVLPYPRGSWGPDAADGLLGPDWEWTVR